MTPIDDELRAALHRRATGVPPSPDPLAGIERRATRMRRHRLAASAAGSVLAVAAVATAVPLLTDPAVPERDLQVAEGGPSAPPGPAPTSATTTSPYALDPAAPWHYRGVPQEQLGQGTVETVRQELATARGVEESSVALRPLFGQVHEPSAQVELVYVAQVDGAARWGVARSSEAGPEFAVDEPLRAGTTALVAALLGDEVGRLVVVASPAVGAAFYGPDGASKLRRMTSVADGVATGPLDGDPATDVVKLIGAPGEEVFLAPAPDVAAAPSAAEPANPFTD